MLLRELNPSQSLTILDYQPNSIQTVTLTSPAMEAFPKSFLQKDSQKPFPSSSSSSRNTRIDAEKSTKKATDRTSEMLLALGSFAYKYYSLEPNHPHVKVMEENILKLMQRIHVDSLKITVRAIPIV